MAMIDDPSMKEIVLDFCIEAEQLFDRLEKSLEILEEHPEISTELEKFGQIIDRIMGAAKSIGAHEIASFCQLGKLIGYKSSQVKDLALVEIVVAILFDSLHMLRKMIIALRDGNDSSMEMLNTKAFATRLHWLSDKFKDIDRASCEATPKGKLDQNTIDDIMTSLGL